MLKRILLAVLLLANGCSNLGLALPVKVQEDPKVADALLKHQAVLEAISSYVAQLQEHGFLPKPEVLEKKEQ